MHPLLRQAGTVLSLCLHGRCAKATLEDDGQHLGRPRLLLARPPTTLSPAAAAVRDVTVEARPGRSRSMATAAPRHHDGGDGICSCSYTSADVSLPPVVAATG